MKQNFEQIMRNKVSNHEVPYQAGAWEKFQQNIPAATPFYKKSWFVASGLALLIASGIIFYHTTGAENTLIEKENLAQLTNKESINQNTRQPNQLGATTATPINIKETDNNTQPEQITSEEATDEINTDNTPVNSGNSELDESKEQTNLTGSQTTLPLNQEGNSSAENGNQEPQNQKPVEINTAVDFASADFYLEKTVCKGNSIILIADDVNPAHSYLWTVNDKKVLKGSSVTLKATESGLNAIELSVRNKAGKIIATKSSTIEVIELPEASIEVENDEFSIKNNYKFEVLATTNSIIKWDLGDGTTSNKAEINHTYTKGGIVKATCTITNEQGCSNTYTEKIDVKGLYNIRTDYGFSPNGDNINDEFIPVALTTLNVPFTMNIYARGGQLIYTTNSLQQPWNGTMQDGTKSPFGSYVWVVTLTNEYGNQEVYKGTVTNVTN